MLDRTERIITEHPHTKRDLGTLLFGTNLSQIHKGNNGTSYTEYSKTPLPRRNIVP